MKRAATLIDAESVGKIRLLGIVVIMVSLGGSTAFALDPMGPPLARVEEGQFLIGADLSLSKMDVQLSDGKWTEINEDGDQETGKAVDLTLDFETAKLYGIFGYGIAENWEAFLRLGAAKAEFGDSIWLNGEDFDSNIELAIGGGIRGTLFEIPGLDLQIGGLLQANWSNFDGKLDSPLWSSPDFVEVSLAEAQIAIGATYAWTEGLWVYGGPFVHFVRGDVEDIFADAKYSWDIDEGPIYGGYLGALVEIAENCLFHAEYQHSSDANAFGAGLSVRY